MALMGDQTLKGRAALIGIQAIEAAGLADAEEMESQTGGGEDTEAGDGSEDDDDDQAGRDRHHEHKYAGTAQYFYF
jgi:hypothetical protein